MRTIRLLPLLLAPALGCELVADIEDRSVYEDPAGGAGGAGQGGAGAAGQPSDPGGAAGLSGSSGQGGAGAAGEGPGGAGAGGAGAAGEGGAGQGGAAGDAGQGGDAGTAGAAGSAGATCGFPTGSGTGLRVGNLVPSTARYDVCIKPKADANFSQIKPLLHADGCPGGLAYKQLSASIDQPAGIYDVKFIASTATDCNDPGVGTLESVTVASGAVTDVFLAGSAGDFAPLKLTESTPLLINNTAFRFLHAARGVGSVNVTLASGPTPPVGTSLPNFFSDVSYLKLPTDSPFSEGAVDANGYLQIAGPGVVNIGVGDSGGAGGAGGAGQPDARLVRTGTFSSNVTVSLFLVGTPADPNFPQETLLCEGFGQDEQAPYLARCNGGQSFVQPTRFGTLNAQLTGIFAAYEPDRRPAVIKAASDAAADLDVLCVGEAWAQADKDAIVSGAQAKFPHSLALPSDESTPIEDPTDQGGEVPAPYAGAPCVDDNKTKLENLLTCLEDKCAADGTSGDQAVTEWGTCASGSNGCQLSFAPLLFSADKACYSCALVQTQSYQTMADIRANCTEPAKKNRRFAFRGNHGAVLLSKNEIVDSELVMLPATEWRVGVLRAGVKLANSSVVDVYCTTLTTPASSNTRPYTGQYGGGQTPDAKAWDAENKLQVEKLAALVHERSRYRRAVVLGELYTGPDYKEGATQVLDGYTPGSWQVVTSSFALGVAPGYKPACTQCASNPLVGGTKNYWASHALLWNVPVTSVTATSIGFTESVVPVTDANGKPQTVPLSTHYGLRTTLALDP